MLPPSSEPEGAVDITAPEVVPPVMVVLTSRPYTKNSKCRLCATLPDAQLVELTIDLLQKRRTKDEIMEFYQQFLPTGSPKINWYNLKSHLEHSTLEAMSDQDRKALQLMSRKSEMVKEAIKVTNGTFSLDKAHLDIIKKITRSLTTFEEIFAREQAELIELESQRLPENMKDAHQEVNKTTGEVTTDPLYPLIERKRRQVLRTQTEINDTMFHLAEAIRDATKGTGSKTINIAVDEIFGHLTNLKLAMKDYGQIGIRILKEYAPENNALHDRWLTETGRFFQERMITILLQVQSILRALTEVKV